MGAVSLLLTLSSCMHGSCVPSRCPPQVRSECGFHFQGQTKRKRKKNSSWEGVGYICGGYKLRGRSTCQEWFLPEDIIEETVFEALDKEVQTLNLSGAIDA